MTIKQTIQQLQAKGIAVTYRKRTDGGYIITSINGVKFTGAQGNTKARELTGNYLSNAQKEQRFNINPKEYKKQYEKKFQKPYKRGKAPKVDKNVKAMIKSVQRLYKVNNINGTISTTRVREKMATLSITELKNYFSFHERRAKGFASYQSINSLIDRLEMMKRNMPQYSNRIARIINSIKRNKETFKETTIQSVLDGLYDIGKIEDEMAVQNTLSELNKMIKNAS